MLRKEEAWSISSLLSARLGPCLMEDQGPNEVNKLLLSYYSIRLDKQRRQFPELRSSEWVQERSENVWKQPVEPMTSWAKTASPWVCVASPQQAQVTCGRAEHPLPWPSDGEGGAQGECQRNSCREGNCVFVTYPSDTYVWLPPRSLLLTKGFTKRMHPVLRE